MWANLSLLNWVLHLVYKLLLPGTESAQYDMQHCQFSNRTDYSVLCTSDSEHLMYLYSLDPAIHKQSSQYLIHFGLLVRLQDFLGPLMPQSINQVKRFCSDFPQGIPLQVCAAKLCMVCIDFLGFRNLTLCAVEKRRLTSRCHIPWPHTGFCVSSQSHAGLI